MSWRKNFATLLSGETLKHFETFAEEVREFIERRIALDPSSAPAINARLDVLTSAITDLTRILAAPKMLVMEDGKPVGVRTKLPN
jgi:hypothetical protein